jgi:Ca2+-binding EF-hand superfamily protein
LDTDTGELSREQLRDVVESCGIQLTDQGHQELFIVCDSDGNGAISREEFVAWMMSREESKFINVDNDINISVESSLNESSKLVEYGKHIFSIIDLDNSGEITLEEFRIALLKFNEPPYSAGFTNSEILSLLRDFDEDGDGNISLEEFLKAIETGCSFNNGGTL